MLRDTEDATLGDPGPTLGTIRIPALDLSNLTQAAPCSNFPQPGHGEAIPPISFPALHNETFPTYPPSPPTSYPRTALNTPQATQHLDVDTPMNPLYSLPVSQVPPTPAARISVITNPPTLVPPASNILGLTEQVEAPAPANKKSIISDRLVEVANDRSASDKHPARIAIDRYSPGPMPLIQDATPTSIFDNIHISTIKEWEACPGGKLIAIPFDPNARYPESHEFIKARILTAAAEIISAQEISVVAPKPSEEAEKKNWTPTSFLIYNISDEHTHTLLERKVWSSKAITFRVAPFETTCPTFLFTIRGFTTTAMNDVFEMVRRVWDSQTTKNFVSELLLDSPARERGKIGLEIEHLLTSMSLLRLDIKETGSTLHPRFNIYADCASFSDNKVWTKLRAFLFTTVYISAIQGRATLEKIPFRCSCCHGVDHPRGLCPFPNLQGWNGPKRDQISADSPQRRNGGSPYPDRRAQRQRFQPQF